MISEALFASLVLMALVTTFMAGPLLRPARPDQTRFGAPVEEALDEARAESQAAFLLAPRGAGATDSVRAAGGRGPGAPLGPRETLAGSDPPRELDLARLCGRRAAPTSRRAPDGGQLRTRTRTKSAGSRRAGREGRRGARGRVQLGAPGRRPGPAGRERGGRPAADRRRRPLLGEGVPRGDVGAVLEEAAVRRGGPGRARGTRGARPRRAA